MKKKHEIRTIASSELIGVMQEICKLSLIERTEKSSKWDFDLSVPFLQGKSLDKHVVFESLSRKYLPLNSERHIYELYNIVVRNLCVHCDNRDGFRTFANWHPCSYAKWHFENCEFISPSPNMWSLVFPWEGSFRFYKNKFGFKERHASSCWIFHFQNGSRVLFQRNDFTESDVQVTQASAENGDQSCESTSLETHVTKISGSISFVGNHGANNLSVFGSIAHCSFTGMNRINSLYLHNFSAASPDASGSIYLGAREKIDPSFHHCLHHRELFLSLRSVAASNQDTRLMSVLDKQLERIEYMAYPFASGHTRC